MNLKKKFVIGAASLALVAGMGVAPAMAYQFDLPNGLTVDTTAQRYAGADRVETSLAAAKAAYKDHENDAEIVYLVGYNGLPDAASAGMLDNNSATRGAVVAIPNDLKEQKLFALAIKKAFPKVKKFVALGGTGTVSDEALKAMADTAEVSKTARIGGKDRYETNVAIIKSVDPAPRRIYVASGDVLADGVTAGTLTDGMLVLLPTTGDVPQATKDYVKANATNLQVVVLGGPKVLSDEQVSKMFDSGKKIDTTPWTAAGIQAKLKADVQKYAALYYGQNTWQGSNVKGAAQTPAQLKDVAAEPSGVSKFWNMPYDKIDLTLEKLDVMQTPTDASDDVANGFWGLSGTNADLLDTGTNANLIRTEETSDISVDKPVANGADATHKNKWFAGYLPLKWDSVAAASALEGKTSDAGSIANRQAAVSDAVKDAVAAGAACTNLATTTGAGADKTDAMQAALALLFGTEALKANLATVKDGKLAGSGWYACDGAGKLKGMNQEAINDQVAADMKSSSNIWKDDASAESNAATGTIAYKDAIKRSSADMTAMLTATKTANQFTNWVAIQKGVNARKADFDKREAEGKKALIDAMRDYLSAADPNGTKRDSKSGQVRIYGENRYATSAYVSVFQSKPGAYPTSTVGEHRWGHFSKQYLAGGADANLIDSVFAGQLLEGTILLVPPTGEVNDTVKLELARKGGFPKNESQLTEGIFPTSVYTVGGTGAVADDVFVAAVKAMLA